MTQVGVELKKVRLIEYCPYCGETFMLYKKIQLNRDSLTNIQIKPHEKCDPFIVTLDMNGIIRTTMTIDNMAQEDEIKVKKYIELFNKDEKFIYFYHVQEINEKPVQSSSSGTIITKKVKYHSFARSKFYQEWINYFKDSKSDFNFMISDDMILATINLYDLIRFTVGFDLEKMMERHVSVTSMKEMMDYIKGQVVQYGEQILD